MQNHSNYLIFAVATFIPIMSAPAGSAEEKAGIGVALATDGDRVVIGKLLPDGSAAKSEKLSVGDWIVGVSDESIADTDVSSSSIDSAVALIRGKAGTTVRLTVVSKGGAAKKAFTIPLTRGTIPILEKWGDGKLVRAGEEFPKIEMTLLDGTSRLLKSEELQGRITVFEIWSTWCGPCLKLMAAQQAIAAKHASSSKELAFIGASVDDKPELALELLKSHGWDATTNVWLNNDAIKALHIKSIPVTYLIDSKGNVIANSDEENFQDTLNTLFEQLNAR
ncbi:MAG: PDZ domain-containing protein [Pirellulaceae bacterium]|nr:PDZ domain-containing protein [Pirellulaceae bacterium]